MDFSLFPSDSAEPAREGGVAAEYSVYFHSSKRAGRQPLVDVLMDQATDETVRSVLLVGVEGFGRHRALRGELHEGPIPLVAMTTVPRSEAEPVSRVADDALVTVGDTSVLDAAAGPLHVLGDAFAQLTVHCPIGTDRDDPAGVGGVIEVLRRRGVAGATALSGGDGVAAGRRHRDGLLMRSSEAPALVLSVDSARVLAGAVPELLSLRAVELATAKPIWVWKYRGRVAGTPIAEDVDGWRNLSVYHTEDSLHWRPFQSRLLTALRHAGAAGATVVRGRLAYVFDDPLRPRNGWFARSAAPVMIRVVDTRDRVARWFEMVDELTGDGGLVTCEPVRILGRG